MISKIPAGLALSAILLFTAALPARAADFFIDSDDYQDGEEVVNKFLKEEDYRRMIEDVTRGGATFDWGWVKTEGAAPVEEPAGKKSRFPKLGGKKRGGVTAEPGALGFDLKSYGTVSVNVQSFFGIVPKETLEKVRESFVLGLEQLGLKVTDDAKAPLELGIAIVDLKRESTYIYFGTIQPFIELEVRLRDTATGEPLLLLRNQAHSNDPEDAALNYASNVVNFLR
jgi:hypothetical protein